MPFEAFQESDYRRFWTTQFVSNVGSWMQTVAQGWLVYRLSDSAFLLGFVGFASSAPAIVLMLPGGVLADQLNRKRVVAISQALQALTALLLALSIYIHRITVWQIVAAAVIVGVAQSFSAPAWQAMVVDLLEDRTHLPNAVAMNSLQFNLSRVVGPLLAGITLSAWGSFWCFFLNALSFLPLIWVLYTMHSRQELVAADEALLKRFADGVRFVRRERIIVLLIGIVAAASLFGFPYLNLMPIVARKLFTNDAQGMGYLMGGVGAGALLGALVLSIKTFSARQMIAGVFICLTSFGVALAAVGTMRGTYIVVALLVICGYTMVTTLALCNTSIQQRIPDAMRGRVLSMYTFAFYAFVPFGNLAAGLLAEHRGISTTLFSLGAGLVVSAAAAGVAMTRV
ncbi:MAG TPA: MFS transporter [Thermoanaerobaculia bacterium]|jgi:MFS family permease|nr:MFS transporter [Thermoanaerobaculia bacterium]